MDAYVIGIDLANGPDFSSSDVIAHYGMPRRSGRYEWGSGKDPYQHTRDFGARVEELRKKGWEETPENIKAEFGLSTRQYRSQKGLARDLRRMDQYARYESLKADGLNDSEIAKKMGIPGSTLRGLIDPVARDNMTKAVKTADFLREQVNKKRIVDVGTGTDIELGVSRERFQQSLDILEAEGYHVWSSSMPQPTNPGNRTTIKCLCSPDVERKETYDYEKIKTLQDYVSRDGGDTFTTFQYPSSMDSSRLKIRYAEEGGIDKDGTIEIRRGVKDLSLGDDRYAQVRILVDNTHYLKGMAVYGDDKDFPPGVDVIFNTNKKTDKTMQEVLKPVDKNLKVDPTNPFGSSIKVNGQSMYTDDDGKEKLSLINKRASEGDWSEWADALPAQFLSKQSLKLVNQQLNLAVDTSQEEFDSYKDLNNPVVKRYFLNKFADSCDSAAVHLKAAALPGQKYNVMIPFNNQPDDQVYCPRYPDGTKLALVRYPHGGTFEIPIVTVNNKNALARKTLGADSFDAIGLTSKVAERLSGADFDGDTVMCIPTHDPKGKVHITSTDPLPELVGFDSKMYKYSDVKTDANGKVHYYNNGHEFKIMSNTQTQMGVISNLITDMTLLHADESELARAVKHSMVVIDAEKHKLDYKQSEYDNNIKELKAKYQSKILPDGTVHVGGAGTLISRSKGKAPVDKRQGAPIVNLKGTKDYDPSRPEGVLMYKTADDNKLYYNKKTVNAKTGEVTYVRTKRTDDSTKMAETDDARTLLSDSGNPVELAYADYANTMKKMAQDARIEAANVGKIARNANAAREYEAEVKSLKNKLDTASVNAPRERAALIAANVEVANARAKYAELHPENPKMPGKEVKKIGSRAVIKNRSVVSAVSRRDRSINITEREWEAIQKGAVSENVLSKILNNSDVDKLRELATPREKKAISDNTKSRIRSLSTGGATIAEIAAQLGVSTSTVTKYMKGDNG